MVLKYTQTHEFCEKELEQFLIACESKYTKSELYQILTPLRWKLRIEFWKKKLIVFGLIALIGICINYVNILNWHAAAIGRICLIKLLGIWDWTKLYNEKCLINNWFISKYEKKVPRWESKLYEDDCVVCENYGK